jgi:hypothetical protein
MRVLLVDRKENEWWRGKFEWNESLCGCMELQTDTLIQFSVRPSGSDSRFELAGASWFDVEFMIF